MDIKAADVKALRDATGAGMMDAKKALVEAGGEVERAKQILREKGITRVGKLSERSAEEGVVTAVLEPAGGAARTGVLIELNCATDFVAKTERFTDLARDIAQLAAGDGEASPADVDALLERPLRDRSVREVLGDLSAEVGEPIRVRRFVRFDAGDEGLVEAYLHQPDPHMPPKIGVLLDIEGGSSEALRRAARELALHIAAMRPTYVTRDEVPSDEVEKEREIVTNQARQSGKPENVIGRIVEGRLKDFFAQIVLLDQPYVRDDKLTVSAFLDNASKDAGSAVRVRRFARFRVGGE